METLKMEKPKEVAWDYDKDADMLYISFGPPQEALTMDLGAGILARYLERNGNLVGFTIVGVSSVLGVGHQMAVRVGKEVTGGDRGDEEGSRGSEEEGWV